MFNKSKRRLRLLSMSIVLSMATQMGASVVFAKENDAAFLSCSDDLVYEVTENRQSLWDGHMVVEYTVKNSGSKEISDWNFLVNIPYDIESIWNAKELESDGAFYQIGNYGWNSTIQPGQSITFGMTLSGIQDTSNIESPTTWLLNSSRKALASDSLSVTYTEYSNWGSGFNGVLKITNNANTTINDWSFDITTNRPITSVSNATFKDNGNNSYTLTNAGYNATLNAHSTIEININGGANDKSTFAVSIANATGSGSAFSLKTDNDKNGVPDYQEYIHEKQPDIPVVSPTPTSTPAPTATPTSTPVPTATSTPVPTATSTPVPTATSTPVPTATSTPVPTATSTPVPTATSTPVPTATSTPVPTATSTPVPTATSTPVPTATSTPVPTATSTPVPTITPTGTPTPTISSTPVPTMTPTGTPTPTISSTPTPTISSTPTPTPAVVDTDSDHDGLSDADEAIWGTDPLNPDTDGDSLLDGDEVRMGKNPLDPSDKDLKVEQTLTIDINNDEDQAVTSISVTMNLARPIDRVLTIKDVYQTDWYTRDLYSRLGSPVSFECAEEFDTAKVVFHYAEGFLDDTNEDDLGVLWYDEENCCYIEQEQAVVDKEANTVSMEVTHFSTYAMHDTLKWRKLKIPGTKHCFYAHVEDTYSVVKGQTLDMDAAERWVYFWYSLSLSGDVKKVVKISRSAEFKEYWGYEEVYTITCDWLIFMEYDEDENGVYDFLEDGSEHMATNGHVYTNSDPFEHVFVTKSNGTIYVTKGLPASTVSYTGDIPDDSPDKWLKTFIEKLAEDITYVFRRLKNGDPIMSTDKYYGIENKNDGNGLGRIYTFYYCDQNGRYDLYTTDNLTILQDHMRNHWGYEYIYQQYLTYTRDELYFDLAKADSFDFDGDGIPDYKDTATIYAVNDHSINNSNGDVVRYCVYNEAGFSSTFKIYVNYIDDANLVATLDSYDAFNDFKTGDYKELFGTSAHKQELNFNVTYYTIDKTKAEKLDYDHDGLSDYIDCFPGENHYYPGSFYRNVREKSGISSIPYADVLYVCEMNSERNSDHNRDAAELNASGLSAYAFDNLSLDDYKTILVKANVCVFATHGGYIKDYGPGLITNIYYDRYSSEDIAFLQEAFDKELITKMPLGYGERKRVCRIVLKDKFFSEYYGNKGLSSSVILSESCHFFGDGKTPANDFRLVDTLRNICGSPFVMGFEESVGSDYAYDFVKNMIDLYEFDNTRYYWNADNWLDAFNQTRYLIGFTDGEKGKAMSSPTS